MNVLLINLAGDMWVFGLLFCLQKKKKKNRKKKKKEDISYHRNGAF
jgi:hypothetical protein